MTDYVCMFVQDSLMQITPSASSEAHEARPYPAEHLPADELSLSQKQLAAGFMRVNHAGEVCAQALYSGQAFAAKSREVSDKMRRAAAEELDHLDWCQSRLSELGSHTSYLNPVWYLGSFTIGAVAGWIGDDWSLGFVEETETQVVSHLEGHLHLLPECDARSRAVIEQMRTDEAEHAQMASQAGARELPQLIKTVMQFTSKVMTSTSYWV